MEKQSVHEVMNKNIIAALENSTLEYAEEIMQKNQIRHLPVINSSGRIIGLLSDRDIKHPTKAAHEYELVKYHMRAPVLDIKANDSIESAAKRMIKEKVSCLLIVDEYSAYCGIVTSEDLLKFLVEFIEDKELKAKAPIGNLFQLLKAPTYE